MVVHLQAGMQSVVTITLHSDDAERVDLFQSNYHVDKYTSLAHLPHPNLAIRLAT
jgi:hypothetical protein